MRPINFHNREKRRQISNVLVCALRVARVVAGVFVAVEQPMDRRESSHKSSRFLPMLKLRVFRLAAKLPPESDQTLCMCRQAAVCPAYLDVHRGTLSSRSRMHRRPDTAPYSGGSSSPVQRGSRQIRTYHLNDEAAMINYSFFRDDTYVTLARCSASLAVSPDWPRLNLTSDQAPGWSTSVSRIYREPIVRYTPMMNQESSYEHRTQNVWRCRMLVAHQKSAH